MKKMLFVTFVLIGLIASQAMSQTTIWSENFESYADNSTSAANNNNPPAGVDWTLSGSANGYWRVESTNAISGSRSMTGNNTDGTMTWTSETIDISGYTNVSVSMLIGEIGHDNSGGYDKIEAFYNIGSGDVEIDNGDGDGNFGGTTTLDVSGLSGSTLVIKVTVRNSRSSEYGSVDNITVQGTAAAPPGPVANLVASGNCLDFDDAGGSNGDYVALPGNFPELISTDFTIAAWINSDNVGTNGQRIFCWDETNTSAGFSLSLGDPGSGRLRFYIRGASGGAGVSLDVTNSDYYLSSNTWYHVAIVHTTTGNNTRTIYINGVNVASDTYTNNPSGKSGTASIGGETNSGETNNRFNGEIDEVSIWSTGLSQTQIRNLMCSKLDSNETNLMAYYRFDESSGTTAYDATANRYNGTLTNMNPASDWVTSGAPIGNTSAYEYRSNWSGYVLTHTSPDGDSLQVSSVTGSPECVHIYNVSELPNTTSGVSGLGSNNTYYGVFHGFGSSTTYTATKFYGENNAFQATGAADEIFTAIYTRTDNSSSSWVLGSGVINTINNTLTITALSTEFILGNTNNPLPVEMLKFEGDGKQHYNELNWSTATEINADRFEIERSANGINWEYIGEVEAVGNSNALNEYSYSDNQFEDDISYYRLKQLDFDGRFEYSAVIIIERQNDLIYPTEEFNLSIFPNPASVHSVVGVKSNNSLKEFGFAEIYDMQGKFVVSSPLFRTQSENQVELHFENPLMAGGYFVKLVGNYSTKTIRLQVQ